MKELFDKWFQVHTKELPSVDWEEQHTTIAVMFADWYAREGKEMTR